MSRKTHGTLIVIVAWAWAVAMFIMASKAEGWDVVLYGCCSAVGMAGAAIVIAQMWEERR